MLCLLIYRFHGSHVISYVTGIAMITCTRDPYLQVDIKFDLGLKDYDESGCSLQHQQECCERTLPVDPTSVVRKIGVCCGWTIYQLSWDRDHEIFVT